MTDGWYNCDRCGEFERGPIQRGTGPWMTDYAEPEQRRIEYGHLTGEDDTASPSKTFDLCHDCRKALTEWIGEVSDRD